jgi:hypothetical protein
MPQFEEFKKTHGPAANCRPVPTERLAAYNEKLPAALLAEWRESGWCAYGDGLIWLEDPDALKAPVKEWLGAKTKAIPFARSAFAHVFLWDAEAAYMLDPHHGTLAKIVNNINVVFDYVLCRKQYLEDVLDQKLFRKALKKLGPLQHDGCYGFEPAIALGGSASLANLNKVKLREHLSILSQLVDQIRNV